MPERKPIDLTHRSAAVVREYDHDGGPLRAVRVNADEWERGRDVAFRLADSMLMAGAGRVTVTLYAAGQDTVVLDASRLDVR